MQNQPTHNRRAFLRSSLYAFGGVLFLPSCLKNYAPFLFFTADEATLMAERPVIPCLACHQIHGSNQTMAFNVDYGDPEKIFYDRKNHQDMRNPAASLFLRADKMFLRADMLPQPDMFHQGKKIRVSADPIQRLCIQCHAPNYRRFTGSEDDRTPTGVHQGLSCISCHDIHSNDATNSCVRCHPAASANCGLDVRTMNTTYFDRRSEHNIHAVSCEDCH